MKTNFLKLKPNEKMKIIFLLPENINKDFPLIKPFKIEKKDNPFIYKNQIECHGKNCPFCKAKYPKEMFNRILK